MVVDYQDFIFCFNCYFVGFGISSVCIVECAYAKCFRLYAVLHICIYANETRVTVMGCRSILLFVSACTHSLQPSNRSGSYLERSFRRTPGPCSFHFIRKYHPIVRLQVPHSVAPVLTDLIPAFVFLFFTC